MEVFIRNVPNQVSDSSLARFLQPRLKNLGIFHFSCHKFIKKPFATLTLRNSEEGTRFLRAHEHGNPLVMNGTVLQISRSRRIPDEKLVQSLEYEATNQQAISAAAATTSESIYPTKPFPRKFVCTHLTCGQWDYKDSDLQFLYQTRISISGNVFLGRKTMIVDSMALTGISPQSFQVHFTYSAIESMAIGDRTHSLIICLSEAPKMFRSRENLDGTMGLYRVAGLTAKHEEISGICLVYQVTFREASDMALVKQACDKIRLASISCVVPSNIAVSLASQWEALWLRVHKSYSSLEFTTLFQIQRLVQNGYLTVHQLFCLLPAIHSLSKKSGSYLCAAAIRRMSEELPFSGPENDWKDFSKTSLSERLLKNAVIATSMNPYTMTRRRENERVCDIHRLLVTPAGEYLNGPDPETDNRVIRLFPDHTDYFIRVVFCEEDFEPLRHGRGASLSSIFTNHFKDLLNSSVTIAGRKYEFLGFSNSSLRAQSCWFMAPIDLGGRIHNADSVIASLGDFSEIRVAAKHAARIGQAFSDTSSSIAIEPSKVKIVNDVERNGRVFSDGCGTISYSMLETIWDNHVPTASFEPKLYQIRFAGAKGMISLDSRLPGDTLCLRRSMLKFESSASNIEVCGSSARSLPMNLNRQYIKILDDLGVPAQVFLDIQARAVNKLKQATAHPINAAKFLETAGVCRETLTDRLIRNLHHMGFDFRQDIFLHAIVNLAILVQLREIKYRCRVVVDNAATLYGIMDETDELKPGEVFCKCSGTTILGKVLVARAPALHPGDMQMADAVNVDPESILRDLDNCVVFSQQGKRDLPSQLSGGDLDGDLYNIIWNEKLHPPRTVAPADYPRVQAEPLPRPVTKEDITQFFLGFLENDQLGRIANLHLQLADTLGTEDPTCLALAELHSQAVDYSKTGVPADMSKLPRYSSVKPDYMATGPRVHVSELHDFVVEEEQTLIEDGDSDLDNEEAFVGRPAKYYKSTGVLGQLFRNIDERGFLENLRAGLRASKENNRNEKSLLTRLWASIQQDTRDVNWVRYKEWARDIRGAYEENLIYNMHQFSPHPSQPVSEVEIFVGTLLGNGNASIPRRAREANKDMKERFDQDAAFIVGCIVKGDSGDADVGRSDALARAMACLWIGMNETTENRARRKMNSRLQSFQYIAAAICLQELRKRGRVSNNAISTEELSRLAI